MKKSKFCLYSRALQRARPSCPQRAASLKTVRGTVPSFLVFLKGSRSTELLPTAFVETVRSTASSSLVFLERSWSTELLPTTVFFSLVLGPPRNVTDQGVSGNRGSLGQDTRRGTTLIGHLFEPRFW